MLIKAAPGRQSSVLAQEMEGFHHLPTRVFTCGPTGLTLDQVAFEDFLSHGSQRPPNPREEGQDLVTGAILLNHPGQASDLALDAPQAAQDLLPVLLVDQA
jgi:hypothetical protein